PEDDRELGLLLDRSRGGGATAGARGRRDGDRCGRHAPALLEELAELGNLEDRPRLEVFGHLLELLGCFDCHVVFLLTSYADRAVSTWTRFWNGAWRRPVS